MRKLLDFLEAKARLAAKSQATRRQGETLGAEVAQTSPLLSDRQGDPQNMYAEHLKALLKTCHEVSKVADCPLDTIRPHLVKTVQMFGYEVREAEPLSVSRGGRGKVATHTPARLFDHLTSLRIELQPLGINQTLLTFSYIVKCAPEVTPLDRQTLELEASTMITFIELVCRR